MILYRSDQSSIIIYMDQRDAPPAPGNMNTTYNMPTAGFHRLFVGTGRLFVRRILWRRNVYVYVYE